MLRASSSSAGDRSRFFAIAGTWNLMRVYFGRSARGLKGLSPVATKRRFLGSYVQPCRSRTIR